MSHKLTRLSKSIFDHPQLILPKNYEDIATVLESGEERLYESAMLADKVSNKDNVDLAEGNVGVLRIEGALTNKPTIFGALCGLTSYQELLSQTEELVSMDNVNTIMMLINSGGGEAYNCFNAASVIKEKVNAAGKKLVAFIDGVSASAAYALTSVADEVIIHPDAMAGSIGVVVRLTNTNKADKNAGIETTYITAGASKVPFDASGDFRKEFKEDLQERVDELYLNFVTHVASNRGISEDSVMDTEAKMFSAAKAKDLGLVDKIMTNEEFYEYLADLSDDNTPATTKQVNVIKVEKDDHSSSLTTQSDQKDTISMTDNHNPELSVDEAKLAELSVMQEKLAAFEAKEAEFAAQADALAKAQEMAEKLAQFEAKEQATKLAELSASLDKFSFLADSKESVVAFLSDTSVTEDHKSLLNTVLEKAAASYEEVEAQAAESIAVAQLEAEQVKEEKEKLKAEFGEKEHGVATSVVKDPVDFKASLAAKVQEQKAAKAANA